MSRIKIIAGNWKLNKGTGTEAAALVSELAGVLPTDTTVEIVVCPPYTALSATYDALNAAPQAIGLGAQDVFWKSSGAYTGQVSAPMLAALGVKYVIIGHSEARGRFGVPDPDFTPDILKQFGETDTTVNLKTKAALSAGLIPIVCVGETLAEREAAETDAVVATQVTGALSGIPVSAVAGLVFAYEPVWAIGTGKVCESDEADRVCGVIRSTVATLYDTATAEAVRVQYGGSMKPDNAAELLAKPNIDGGLVGGASLKARDFAAIIAAAQG
jgi:triosephosphate isomerase